MVIQGDHARCQGSRSGETWAEGKGAGGRRWGRGKGKLVWPCGSWEAQQLGQLFLPGKHPQDPQGCPWRLCSGAQAPPSHRRHFLPWSGLWPPPGSSDASSLGSSLCNWGPWYSSQPALCSGRPATLSPSPTALCFLFSNSISHSSPTHPRLFHCVFRNSCVRVGTF